MPLSPGPWVKPQYFDDDGNPANAFRLFFYDAGTSTKRDTYQDADQSSLNTNPVVLDAAGRANIFLLPTLYKIVYAEPGSDDPPSSPIWTVDDVGPSGSTFSNVDIEITAGENLALNDVIYLSDGSGALTAGRWYKADADAVYSSTNATTLGIATAAITSGDTGTARRDGRMEGLSGLTAGTVYYVSATAGGLTSSAPANAIPVGKADSTTTLVLDPQWGYFNATSNGVMSTGTQEIPGAKTFRLQPQTYIGTATTLPATMDGVYFKDAAQQIVTGVATNETMSDFSIPANMLNADGKGVEVECMSSVGMTGADNKQIQIVFASATLDVYATATSNQTFWISKTRVVRTSSTTADFYLFRAYTGAASLVLIAIQNVTALDFTAAITHLSRATVAGTSTVTQTSCIGRAIG